MPSAAGEKDSDTVWLQDKHGAQHECITGASNSGIGGVSAVATIILQEVQSPGKVNLVGLSVGEV